MTQVPLLPSITQYAELGEDELIELAALLGEQIEYTISERDMRLKLRELRAVTRALKARRDASAPARVRIGEYLRQQGIVGAKYQRDATSSSDYTRRNAKPPEEILHEVQADEYAKKAKLRLGDLACVVSPTIRDSKSEFYTEQQDRLAYYLEREGGKLSEKQRVLLSCIAKGHVATSQAGSYRRSIMDTNCEGCSRPDGRIVGALRNRGLLDTRRQTLAWNSSFVLMLKKPE